VLSKFLGTCTCFSKPVGPKVIFKSTLFYRRVYNVEAVVTKYQCTNIYQFKLSVKDGSHDACETANIKNFRPRKFAKCMVFNVLQQLYS
jgi:hypothetical protein